MFATVTPVNSILASADVAIGTGNAFLSIIQIITGLASIGLGIFVAIDANKYSDEAHKAAGAPKMLWVIGGPLVGILCCCSYVLGFVIPALWFFVFKKKVEAAQGGGFGYGGPPPPPGGFGGPPPGGFGGPPPPGGGYPPPPPPPGGGYPPPPGGGFPPPPGQ